MIGVSVRESELETVREFFELFKTPWEPARAGRRYRVVLGTSGCRHDLEADLFLVYRASEDPIDRETRIPVERTNGPLDVEWEEGRVPLYGNVAFFATRGTVLTSDRRALDYRWEGGSRAVWRVGYDLFEEVRYLLTQGQPARWAMTPTLELHIALLRRLLLSAGASFVEVPPRPAAYDFICCLTHDIDFVGIRRHLFDRTLAGFVRRASVGTLRDLVARRRSIWEALRNWTALVSLPLVFTKLMRDFWRPLEDYRQADGRRASTFFVVPFRNRGGVAPDGRFDRSRALKYQASEIAEDLRRAIDEGNEVAVHGIDAWHDSAAGREELAQVTALTGCRTAGIRMHWLYFTGDTPLELRTAGFDYDSTWGYNDAVGYRAGTSQAFCLQHTVGLMELPMAIMDSAMLFPNRMNLRMEEAKERFRTIVGDMQRFGGALVINWHDRSLAPERLWDRHYRALLEQVAQANVWYATAAQAVEWFKWRRSVRFSQDPLTSDGPVMISAPATPCGGTARVYRISGGRVQVDDHPLDCESVEIDLSSAPPALVRKNVTTQ